MKKRFKKSCFAVSGAVFEAYRLRKITATDVKIFTYLCNLRRRFNGVQVSQRRIAGFCGVTEKTVAAGVERLYNAGLVTSAFTMRKTRHFRFETAVYGLKPITKGFFLFPRSIFFPRRRFAAASIRGFGTFLPRDKFRV